MRLLPFRPSLPEVGLLAKWRNLICHPERKRGIQVFINTYKPLLGIAKT
jgi:hypothetical protein